MLATTAYTAALSVGLAPKRSRAVVVGGVMEGNCQQLPINKFIIRYDKNLVHPPQPRTETGQTSISSHSHWTGSSRRVCNKCQHDPRICYSGYRPIDDAR